MKGFEEDDYDFSQVPKSTAPRRFETLRSSKSRSMVSQTCLFSFPLFAGRDPQFVQAVAMECEVNMFSSGNTILKEGDYAETTFFLVMGKVQVTKTVEGQEQPVAELGSGVMFGELSLFIGGACRRTATIKALEFCDCRVIHQRMFNKILKRFPEERRYYDKLASARQAELQNVTSHSDVSSRTVRNSVCPRAFFSFQASSLQQQEGEDAARELPVMRKTLTDVGPSKLARAARKFTRSATSATCSDTQSVRWSTLGDAVGPLMGPQASINEEGPLADEDFGCVQELELPHVVEGVEFDSMFPHFDEDDWVETTMQTVKLRKALPQNLRQLIGAPSTAPAPVTKHFSILPGPRKPPPGLPEQSRRRPLARHKHLTSAIGSSIHTSLKTPEITRRAGTAPARPGLGLTGTWEIPDLGTLEAAAQKHSLFSASDASDWPSQAFPMWDKARTTRSSSSIAWLPVFSF